MSFIKGKGFVHDADAISQIAANPSGALDALLPTRILYVTDIPAAWFNGSKNDAAGVIPLTATEAVVGTTVRVRGTVRTVFQGDSANAGGDALFALAFNTPTNAANRDEGVLLSITGGNANIFTIDVTLELKAGTSGKYKIGLASGQSYVATALIAATAFQRWGNIDDSTLYEIDQTVEPSIASTEGLILQLQVAGGSSNLSVCNFVLDANYEITIP